MQTQVQKTNGAQEQYGAECCKCKALRVYVGGRPGKGKGIHILLDAEGQTVMIACDQPSPRAYCPICYMF